MNDFDKKLDFDSNTFENMKHDICRDFLET